MNQKTRKTVIQQIVQIASYAITDQDQINQIMESHALRESSFHLTRLITTEGISFLLVDDAINEHEKLLERLLQQERWQDKFSSDYLDKAMQRIIASLIKEKRAALAGSLFDQLTHEYDIYSREHVVYIPLAGVNLPTDSFPMGNIVFRKMTEIYLNDLFDRIKSIVLFTPSEPEVKEKYILRVKQGLETLRDAICAEYHIVAEPQRARERAEEETRDVLDLLRYSISLLYPEKLNVGVGFQGEIISFIRIEPILSSDEQSFELHHSHKGPLCPFELSTDNLQKLEQVGIFKVADMLKYPEKATDFDKTLLRGIHWFANSRIQFERENEFLNLMTCLETFLTRSGQAFISPSLAEQVADSVARLLTTKLENRKALKQRVKDLYGMRSGVSHGGAKTILETNLTDLRNIAKELIFQMIERKDEFRTHQEFLNWIDERRLAG